MTFFYFGSVSAWQRAQLFLTRTDVLGKVELSKQPGLVWVSKASERVAQITGHTFRSTCEDAKGGLLGENTCVIFDTWMLIISVLFWVLVFACCCSCCCQNRGKRRRAETQKLAYVYDV